MLMVADHEVVNYMKLLALPIVVESNLDG